MRHCDGTHLPFVEFDKSVLEVGECVSDTGVVGQGEERVGLSHWRHGAQACLPALLVPVDELEVRLQSVTCTHSQSARNLCITMSKQARTFQAIPVTVFQLPWLHRHLWT